MLRIELDADGDLATTNDRVDLEPFRVGRSTDRELAACRPLRRQLGRLGAHVHAVSQLRQHFGLTRLSDWADSNGFTPVGGIHVDQNSTVLGWQIAVGSFNGTNDMYLDHLHVGAQAINFA